MFGKWENSWIEKHSSNTLYLTLNREKERERERERERESNE